ncbi:Rv1733c family protein [Pseudonocardia pini]|uniref:Rv1733c family protein n=1 Tax=Pseudonocardia pini TaxID=2758030 RepID=UPI0015F0D65A|nr:hypothetical protein [Pseudonocardia pini]
MKRAGEHARPSRDRPPRRRSDRVADVVAWAVGVGALLVLLACLVIGVQSYRALSERAQVEERRHTPTTAVVLEDVGMVPEAGAQVLASVRWTGADGIERTGRATVTAPVPAGTEIGIWVTADQRPVRAPLSRFEVVFVAAVTAAVSLAVGEVVVGLLGRLAFVGVTRLRGDEWERAWEETEPRWTGGGPPR